MSRAGACCLILMMIGTGCASVKPKDGTAVLHQAVADHVSIGVDDYDASLRWYQDMLGFSVEKQWTVDGLPGVRLAYLIKNGFRVEVISGGQDAAPARPGDFQQHFDRKGFGHLCLRVADVDAAMAELARRGVPAFVPAKDYPVGAERRVAFVLDNGGNVIEFAGPLVEPRPTAD